MYSDHIHPLLHASNSPQPSPNNPLLNFISSCSVNVHGHGTLQWGTDNLPVATPPEKNDSPSSSIRNYKVQGATLGKTT